MEIQMDQLKSRWLREERSQFFLNAILTSLDPKVWYEQCPKLPHGWVAGELCDFRGIDLSRRKVGEIFLAEACLDGSSFNQAEFENTLFQYSTISDATFVESKFYVAQMSPIFGKNAKFNHATLNTTFMSEGKVLYCDFTNAVIYKSSFNNTDMTGCALVGVYAEKSRFDFYCKIIQADLRSANFVDCNFSLSSLSGSNLDSCIFERCDLRGVDFTGIQLCETRFVGGMFGIVDHAGSLYPTKFDDTPQNRALIGSSKIDGKDSIEWQPVQEASHASLMADATIPTAKKLRGLPNQTVPQTGWWISPAFPGEQGRRYFEAGQKFPETATTSWGAVIWQYDPEQQ